MYCLYVGLKIDCNRFILIASGLIVFKKEKAGIAPRLYQFRLDELIFLIPALDGNQIAGAKLAVITITAFGVHVKERQAVLPFDDNTGGNAVALYGVCVFRVMNAEPPRTAGVRAVFFQAP